MQMDNIYVWSPLFVCVKIVYKWVYFHMEIYATPKPYEIMIFFLYIIRTTQHILMWIWCSKNKQGTVFHMCRFYLCIHFHISCVKDRTPMWFIIPRRKMQVNVWEEHTFFGQLICKLQLLFFFLFLGFFFFSLPFIGSHFFFSNAYHL